MSIIDDVGNALEEAGGAVVGAAESVAHLAGKVFKAFEWVWWFLKNAAALVFGAWDWMIHGVEWLGVNLDHLAGETFGWAWGIVSHLIPTIAAWVYNHSIGWAFKEIEIAAADAWKWVKGAVSWAGKELSKLGKLLAHEVGVLTKWAAKAVWWVEHRAEWVWHLITHPEALAKLLADHIVLPIVKWILKSSAPIFVWLFKEAASEGSAIEKLIEDILHDML
jgi:hypothetical protein